MQRVLYNLRPMPLADLFCCATMRRGINRTFKAPVSLRIPMARNPAASIPCSSNHSSMLKISHRLPNSDIRCGAASGNIPSTTSYSQAPNRYRPSLEKPLLFRIAQAVEHSLVLAWVCLSKRFCQLTELENLGGTGFYSNPARGLV